MPDNFYDNNLAFLGNDCLQMIVVTKNSREVI